MKKRRSNCQYSLSKGSKRGALLIYGKYPVPFYCIRRRFIFLLHIARMNDGRVEREDESINVLFFAFIHVPYSFFL